MITGNKRKQLIELLRSGNFTVASHDYGQVVIYEGKFKGYNSKKEMPEFPGKEIARFDISDSWGYMQEVIIVLTEALNGSNGGSA